MNALNFQVLQSTFNSAKSYVVQKSSDWSGRAVTTLKSALPYLEDSRIAGATVFVVNFVFIELAIRISQVVGLCFPQETVAQRYIKSTIFALSTAGLTFVANWFFIKATPIALHPLVITALVVATFMTRFLVENYLEPQPTPIYDSFYDSTSP